MYKCVVHLTPVTGSMQASARVARFLADVLKVPLIDSEGSLHDHILNVGPGKLGIRDHTVIFVNGPIAFCGYRDGMGEWLLTRTQKVIWVQQDYTITMPPNQAYSRPTKAETPFRAEFHKIPEVVLWSTCKDVLNNRYGKAVPGHTQDEYVNWNALTYAPTDQTAYPGYSSLFYYGALRAGRVQALARYFQGQDQRIGISLSNFNIKNVEEWRGVVGRGPTLLAPVKGGAAPKVTNGNKWGAQPLLTVIGDHQHALYIADTTSNCAFHSLANRFYEALSAPYTVLWLDSDGADTYDKAGLKGWETYAVSSGQQLSRRLALPKAKLMKMAADQRSAWLPTDPFKALLNQVKILGSTL